MDWKTFGAAFAAIFIAELGDKTQLAALSLSAGGGSRWPVFLGASLALVATTAIAVGAGELVTRLVSPLWLRRLAGVAFLVMGVLYLVKKSD